MKKLLCIIVTLLLAISLLPALGQNNVLLPENADFNVGIKKGTTADSFGPGKYIGFKSVNLDGMNSIIIKAEVLLKGGSDGETIRIKIDDPLLGEEIGSVVICEEKEEHRSFLWGTEGTHDVYFVGTYRISSGDTLKIKSFEFSPEVYEDLSAYDKQVPDSFIKDYYADTWVSVDHLGRKVADFEEAGAVKEDTTVGMFYWHRHTFDQAQQVEVTSKALSENPGAWGDKSHPLWSVNQRYYWDEPSLGFYTSYDHWVYKKHAQLLSSAGVDVIFLDCSNGGTMRVKPLLTLAKAFREAKKEGIKVPKISAHIGFGAQESVFRALNIVYNVCFQYEDLSDVWYFLDGKPMLLGNAGGKWTDAGKNYIKGDIAAINNLYEIADFFTFREEGADKDQWSWHTRFPQTIRGEVKDGRPEFIPVMVGNTSSYINGAATAASSDYSMGKSYSEAFGADYSEDGPAKGYAFREKARLALENNPRFVFVTGWNELTCDLYNNSHGAAMAFIECFDDNRSRDMEPVKGKTADSAYNMLVDFVRKYKGVRPAPLASGKVTISLDGDLSQWNSVAPTFYNYKGEDRNSKGGFIDKNTKQGITYSTSVPNYIEESKVARDDNNYFFMAKANKDIKVGESTLSLYINKDRNPATGFSGYDLVIGRNDFGVIEAIDEAGNFKLEGNAGYKVYGDTLVLSVPKNLISGGISDFEFKWVSGKIEDIMDIYEQYNAAPIGRFNYLYTEIPQKALTSEERAKMGESVILMAGNNKMIAEGKIVGVYDADTRIIPFEMNGTLYVPFESLEEIMGWGKSKVEYDYKSNILHFYEYKLNAEQNGYAENNWFYTVLGSYEGRFNGRYKTLSKSTMVANGKIYVPLSFLSECAGFDVASLGGGVYTVGNIDSAFALSLLGYLG